MDYVRSPITAEDICKLRNIEIIFNKRYHDFSSTNLREKIEKEKSSVL